MNPNRFSKNRVKFVTCYNYNFYRPVAKGKLLFFTVVIFKKNLIYFTAGLILF
ncbi:hypothetical protein WANA31_0483 [Wolbachia endosymbiont of Drosophila ananassae]|nr:hypothetical protein WANA31_0483 [Wolbachia endosymbiont of Drosophila ananassae]